MLVDGYLVHLPACEAALLAVLMARPGQVMYRRVLVDAVVRDPGRGHAVVDRLMSRLRRRIEPSPVSPVRIRRVGDAGYTFSSVPRLK